MSRYKRETCISAPHWRWSTHYPVLISVLRIRSHWANPHIYTLAVLISMYACNSILDTATAFSGQTGRESWDCANTQCWEMDETKLHKNPIFTSFSTDRNAVLTSLQNNFIAHQLSNTSYTLMLFAHRLGFLKVIYWCKTSLQFGV